MSVLLPPFRSRVSRCIEACASREAQVQHRWVHDDYVVRLSFIHDNMRVYPGARPVSPLE